MYIAAIASETRTLQHNNLQCIQPSVHVSYTYM
jgi:hypothetical protein